MNQEQIAEVCARAAHEVNQVFCAANGDPPSPTWECLTDAQRNGIIGGARHALAGGSPEDSHKLWLASRAAEGWTYGETKSFEKKTSPCFLPYEQLPPAQRVKDTMFQSVVRAVASALQAR